MRKARTRSHVAALSARDWRDIVAKHGNRCTYCGVAGKLEMDHVIPLSRGGTHTAVNVLPACRSCNARKGNRLDFVTPYKL